MRNGMLIGAVLVLVACAAPLPQRTYAPTATLTGAVELVSSIGIEPLGPDQVVQAINARHAVAMTIDGQRATFETFGRPWQYQRDADAGFLWVIDLPGQNVVAYYIWAVIRRP